jgi:hypothetical protein
MSDLDTCGVNLAAAADVLLGRGGRGPAGEPPS